MDLVIHLTKGDGAPVQSMVSSYRDSTGNLVIHERASCLDKDGAGPTIVHIPTATIPAQDRKLKAQVEIRGLGGEVLERSKVFGVHFPKADRNASAIIARVRVEPALGDTPGMEQADQYEIAAAVPPVAVHTEKPSAGAPLVTPVKRSNAEVAGAPAAIGAQHSDARAVVAAVSSPMDLPKGTAIHG